MHAWEGTQWVNRYYCFHRYMYTSGYSTYHTTHLHAKALAKCCNNAKVYICSVYGTECILLSLLELLLCLYAGHRDLVNAKSPEHRLQIFSYRLCHFCVCILSSNSYIQCPMGVQEFLSNSQQKYLCTFQLQLK